MGCLLPLYNARYTIQAKQPEPKVIRDFLRHFEGKTVFAAIGDKKNSQRSSIIQMHSFQQEKLETLNAQFHGIFFSVNELNRDLDPEHKRTLKMLERMRAVWVEDDNVREEPRKEWPLVPNLIVNSSPGKYHYYWLTSTDNYEEWDAVMNHMVQEHGCDKNARDGVRVMRIPGFYHHKKDPHLVTFECLREKPYEWEVITTAFPPVWERKSENLKAKSVEELFKDSSEGHVHGPARSLAMKFANGSLSPDDFLALMNLALPEAHDGHHEDCIRTAVNKVAEERDEEIEDAQLPEMVPPTDEQLPFPPGIMGQFAKEIYEMSPYPNQSVSTIAAIGIAAGIMGRAYQVSETGLNLQITMLMNTGMGKDIIAETAEKILYNKLGITRTTFLGSAGYFSMKAMWRDLEAGMSKLCIFTESGVMGQSMAGDKANIEKTILTSYGVSGTGRYLVPTGYSSEKDQMPELHAPSLTIIQESTPKAHIEYLMAANADTKGLMARNWTSYITGDKPLMNRNRRKEFSKPVNDQINRQIVFCNKFQEAGADLSGRVTVKIPEHVLDFSDELVVWGNEARRNGRIREADISNRSYLKAVKICAIIDAFNGDFTLQDETMEWVKKHVIWKELGEISGILGQHDTSDTFEIVKNFVGPKLRKMFDGKLTEKSTPNQLMRKMGAFTLSQFNQAFRGVNAIQSLSSASGTKAIHGTEKVLEFMVKNKFLLKYTSPQDKLMFGAKASASDIFKVTNELKMLMEETK